MKLGESQWHVKWFRWNCRVLDNFTNSEGGREYTLASAADLCTYMRTILLGTVVATFSVAWWAGLVYAIALPFLVFGMFETAFAITSTIAGVALLLGMVWVIGTVLPQTMMKLFAKRPHRDTNPGFISCVAQYMRATKQRFCPLITFTKDR